MHVIVIKYWMNKLFKSISFGAISLEINQLNIHCSTLGSVFLSVLNKGPSCRHFDVSWRSCDTNVMITLCGSSLHDKDADRQLDGLELVAAMRHGYDHQMEQLGEEKREIWKKSSDKILRNIERKCCHTKELFNWACFSGGHDWGNYTDNYHFIIIKIPKAPGQIYRH